MLREYLTGCGCDRDRALEAMGANCVPLAVNDNTTDAYLDDLLPAASFSLKADQALAANDAALPPLLRSALPRLPGLKRQLFCACHAVTAPWLGRAWEWLAAWCAPLFPRNAEP